LRASKSAFTALRSGEGKLFALMPQKIGGVRVGQLEIANRTLIISARLVDEDSAQLNHTVSAEVVVHDESGAERARMCGRFESGRLDATLRLGINEPPGAWRVHVAELFSGKTHSAAVNVPPQSRMRVIRAGGAVDVFRAEKCIDVLRAGRKAALVTGLRNRDASIQLAGELQRFLIQAEVKLDTEVAADTAAELAGDSIIIGYPSVIPALLDAHYPGNGRALIGSVAGLFHPQSNTIVLIAPDAAGIRLGVEKLFELARGRNEEAPRAAVLKMPQTIPPIRLPRAECPEPAISFNLDDGVTALAMPARGRFAVAGSLSGDVKVVNTRGNLIWKAQHRPPVKSLILPAKGADPLVIDAAGATLRSIVSSEKWRHVQRLGVVCRHERQRCMEPLGTGVGIVHCGFAAHDCSCRF